MLRATLHYFEKCWNCL